MNWMTDFFLQLLTFGGIAGVIALMISISICVRYVQHGNEEIPDVLVYALTTILGFYFGAGVQAGAQTKMARMGQPAAITQQQPSASPSSSN
jgi:hypothetical protein